MTGFTVLDGSGTGPVEVEVAPVATTCAACGESHPLMARRTRRLADVPYADHPVVLIVTEGKRICKKSGAVTIYRYPLGRERYTPDLAEYLYRRRGQVTLRDLERRTGLSASQVRLIQQQKHAQSRTARLPSRPPSVQHLGLDDLYLAGAKHLVAVNLDIPLILKLERVSTVAQGRADQFDFAPFLADLPDEVGTVSVDLHAGQLKAARKRWPRATVVADKRHVLQLIDRDVLALASEVAAGWQGEPGTGRRAALRFGPAAYPYLALQSLVLRRAHAYTATDHAAWVLLRREGGRAQQLYEACQWREALYEAYRPDGQLGDRLKAWLGGLTKWRSAQGNDPPLRGISSALHHNMAACAAYTQAGTTNAGTELMNARIRRVQRQGHKYSLETLVQLVNADTVQRRVETLAPGRTAQPAIRWVPAGTDAPAAPVPEPTLTAPGTARRPRQTRPTAEPSSRLRPEPTVNPRHLPRPAPELEMPAPVWTWLHSAVDPSKRGGPRWCTRVAGLAPPLHRRAWQRMAAGQVSSAAGGRVPADVLADWQLAVRLQYMIEQGRVSGRVNHEVRTLQGIELQALRSACPETYTHLQRIAQQLCAVSYGRVTDEDVAVVKGVARWHHALQDDAVTAWWNRGEDAVLPEWSVDGGHRQVTPERWQALLWDPVIRWGATLEATRQAGRRLPAHLMVDGARRASWGQHLRGLLAAPAQQQ